MLIDGLKCDKDLTLFRKKRVFSQVLSLLNTDILNHMSKVGQLYYQIHVLHAHRPCEKSLSVCVCVCVCSRTYACEGVCADTLSMC